MARKKEECRSWVVKWNAEKGKTEFIPKHLYARVSGQGSGLQVIKDIEPFQNIAIDGKTVGGRRQRRDMMRAHGLIEVGNEAPINRFKGAPETSQREMVNHIKQAYRDHGVDVL